MDSTNNYTKLGVEQQDPVGTPSGTKKKKVRKDNKFTRLCKNNEFVLISFFTSVLVSLVFWIVYTIAPFGDLTVLRMDLFHQYGPLFAEFYDRITHGGGLVYSWQSAGGGNFLGNYFNYLSSPISFLVLLFGHKKIPQAIAFFILLKAAFSSANFTYYLKASRQFGRHDMLSAGFGLLYAFSGYFVAYYWNVMWLDGMMLLPLIILGLEKIVDEKKPWLYVASFAVLLVASYYMAYMTAIFMVLYFLAYWFGKHKIDEPAVVQKKGKDGKVSFPEQIRTNLFLRDLLRCIGYACVSGLLAAFAILPTYFALRNCSATSGTFPTKTSSYFQFFDFLANHMDALEPTIRSSDATVLPNVFCGIGTVVLVVLFFYIKSIPIREKVTSAALLAVLYASFNINKLNYIWHGFHFPNDLPYRQSFVYVFFLLVLAFKAVSRLRELELRDVLTVSLITGLFVALIEKIGSANVSTGSVITTFAFLALYVLAFAMATNKKFRTKSIASLLFCVMFAEVVIADVSNFEVNISATDYASDYDEFREVKKFIDQKEGSDDYRMELVANHRIMNPCWYGYNGICEFSSMAYEKSANLQYNLGLMGNYINSYIYSPQTPVYNMMFSLKYLVNNDPNNVKLNKTYFQKIGHSANTDIYRNRNWLPLSFAVPNDVKNWDYYANDPFRVQNDWFARATGVDDVLEAVSVESLSYQNLHEFEEEAFTGSYNFRKINADADASFTFSFTPTEERNYYLYVHSPQIEELDLKPGSGVAKTVNAETDEEHIVDLGVLKPGEVYSVTCPVSQTSGTADVFITSLNDAKFQQGYAALKSGAVQFTKMDNTVLEGTVTVPERQFLYTSINYDSGWQVYVDGQRLASDQVFRVGGALLGVNVPAGTHTVRFEYHAPGLRLGVGISLLTLLLILLLTLLPKRKTRDAGVSDRPRKTAARKE